MTEQIILGIIALLSGIALEYSRHTFTKEQNREVKTVDDITAFRKELLDENRILRDERDEWQNRFYEEKSLRDKAEWKLETLGFVAKERDKSTNPEK